MINELINFLSRFEESAEDISNQIAQQEDALAQINNNTTSIDLQDEIYEVKCSIHTSKNLLKSARDMAKDLRYSLEIFRKSH